MTRDSDSIDDHAKRVLLKVHAPADWELTEFACSVSNDQPVSFAKCRVLIVNDVFEELYPDIERVLVRGGLSNLLRRTRLTEAIVAPAEHPDRIRDLLIAFLKAVPVDQELLLIDPYFFARTNDSGYAKFVAEIFKPFASILKTLVAVTHPQRDHRSTKQAVLSELAKACPGMSLQHKTSVEYHDRFWVSGGRKSGLITGTSLNGLGRKYALVDRLSAQDTEVIVKSLLAAGLIT